ncbi:MAG: DnaJ domain-containing protein [Propionibacteriaceae bacterium]|jgi:molecular chaperone DnaJ|nr:DnaJ domain-containing protein [Propionibacteriaceae bacterium]
MSSKDWLDKDYYKVLGVAKDAKAADIKKAFRKIARENHPDQHPGDKRAEQRFKEASEAHDILSDPDKRKEYDETRSLLGGGFRFQRPTGGASSSGTTSGFEDIFQRFTAGGSGPGPDLGDILGGFGNLFTNTAAGAGSATRRAASKPARRGADIEGTVSITFDQSVSGATVAVHMVSDDPCPACKGTGAKAGTMPRVCPTCSGSGVQPGSDLGASVPCKTCLGRGLLVDEPCSVCGGSGRAKSSQTMNVRIPAGVSDGQRIRIKGKGSKGENGGTAGDLYVTVHVGKHPVFGRSGFNLTVDVPVTYAEAVLGAEVNVPVFNGNPVRLRIPAFTPNGRTFRVRGKGVQQANAEYGDLLVTISVTVPETLSPEAKAALATYSELAVEPDPRTKLFEEA